MDELLPAIDSDHIVTMFDQTWVYHELLIEMGYAAAYIGIGSVIRVVGRSGISLYFEIDGPALRRKKREVVNHEWGITESLETTEELPGWWINRLEDYLDVDALIAECLRGTEA